MKQSHGWSLLNWPRCNIKFVNITLQGRGSHRLCNPSSECIYPKRIPGPLHAICSPRLAWGPKDFGSFDHYLGWLLWGMWAIWDIHTKRVRSNTEIVRDTRIEFSVKGAGKKRYNITYFCCQPGHMRRMNSNVHYRRCIVVIKSIVNCQAAAMSYIRLVPDPPY